MTTTQTMPGSERHRRIRGDIPAVLAFRQNGEPVTYYIFTVEEIESDGCYTSVMEVYE